MFSSHLSLRWAMKWMGLALLLLVLSGATTSVQAQESYDPCQSDFPDALAADGLPVGPNVEIIGCRQHQEGTWFSADVGDPGPFVPSTPPPAGLEQSVKQGRESMQAAIKEMGEDPR